MDHADKLLALAEHVLAVGGVMWTIWWACWKVAKRKVNNVLDKALTASLHRIEHQVTPNGGDSSSLADTNVRQTTALKEIKDLVARSNQLKESEFKRINADHDKLIASLSDVRKSLWTMLFIFARAVRHAKLNDLLASELATELGELVEKMTPDERILFNAEIEKMAHYETAVGINGDSR